MLKKTITYTDYNDVERTEDFYFNLSKAELAEMELSVDGGYAEMAKKIANEKRAPELVKLFKDLILKAYGEKSADGKRFMKVDNNGTPLNIAFSQTEAYSELFMELSQNADAAAKFFTGVIPADLGKQVTAQMAAGAISASV